MLGIGSVAGYFMFAPSSTVLSLSSLTVTTCSGNIDLTVAFRFLGDTELEVLSVLGSFLLVAMHVITAVCTKERVVVDHKYAVVPLDCNSALTLDAAVRKRASARNFATSGTTCYTYPPSFDR